MPNPNIQKMVLELTKKIPKGRVSSYKEISRMLKIHPRQVAIILSRNPHPVRIPCHRIVHADGRVGGYTPKGKDEKIKLLKKEGVKIINGKVDRNLFYFFRA